MTQFSAVSVALTCIVAGAGALGATPAAALVTCPVRQAADGFVALRAAPGAAAKLVGRMKSGDEVREDPDTRPRDGWVYVTWMVWYDTGQSSANTSVPVVALTPRGQGWVNRKLIGPDCG